MKKVLVTGGTGLVGAHLLYELSKLNYHVSAIRRQGSNLDYVKSIFSFYSPNDNTLFSKINWIEGDILDIVSLEDAMKDVNIVFHCAALVAFSKSQHTLIDKTNTEGTANVVNTALAFSVERLIYVSSIAAIGKLTANSQMLNEDAGWKYSKKTSRYSISKYNAEQEVWRGMEEGLSAVIVNPGVIIGPCDWNSNTGVLFKNVYNGLRYYTDGSTGFVDVRDVVKAMIKLCETNILSQKFILVGQNLNYKELLNQIAIEVGKKPPTKSASKFLVQLARRFETILCFFSKREPRITRETANSALSKNSFDGTKIKSAVNFNYRNFNETLNNSWNYIKNKYL